MDIAKPELTAVLTTAAQIETQLTELDDLHLALIGGGVGEVILA